MKNVRISIITNDDDFNRITKKYLTKTHSFLVCEKQTINDLLLKIIVFSGFLFRYLRCGFETTDYFKIEYNGEAREIHDKKTRVYNLLDLYGERESYDLVLYWDYRPGGGAGVLQSEGIYFIIHTDEAIHKHDPHVHARYGGKTMKISILSPSCIGSLGNKKKERAAKRIVHENEMFFMEKWHEYACGLSVDPVYYDKSTKRLEKEQVC